MENFGGGGEILTIKFPVCETGYTSYGCSMVSAGGGKLSFAWRWLWHTIIFCLYR